MIMYDFQRQTRKDKVQVVRPVSGITTARKHLPHNNGARCAGPNPSRPLDPTVGNPSKVDLPDEGDVDLGSDTESVGGMRTSRSDAGDNTATQAVSWDKFRNQKLQVRIFSMVFARDKDVFDIGTDGS